MSKRLAWQKTLVPFLVFVLVVVLAGSGCNSKKSAVPPSPTSTAMPLIPALSELDANLKVLEKKLTVLSDRVIAQPIPTNYQPTINALTLGVETAKSQSAKASSDVAALQTSITALQTAITNLNASFSALNASLIAIKAEIVALKTEITAIKAAQK